MNSTFNSSSSSTTTAEPTITVFVFASFILMLLLSPPLNLYTMWLIVRGGAESINADFYRLNLALSDTLGCLSCLLGVASALHPAPGLPQGDTFFTAFIHIARPMFQTCICGECYLAVVRPVTFLRYKLLRYRAACSSAVWLLTLGGSLNMLLCQACYASSQGITVLLAYYTAQFALMLFCCVSVLRALRRPGPGDGRRERAEGYDAKRRAFNIVMITTALTIVNFFPYVLLLSMHKRLRPQRFQELSTVVSPFIYYFGLLAPLFYLQRVGKLSPTRFLTAIKCATEE